MTDRTACSCSIMAVLNVLVLAKGATTDAQTMTPCSPLDHVCLFCRWEFAAATKSPHIWDVYFTAKTSGRLSAVASTTASSTEDTWTGEPEYSLQVLGRCGEAPSIPKRLTVWLSHVQFASHCWLKHSVQTAPDGSVRLGSLSGIKQVCAQIDSGGDGGANTPAAPTKQPSLVLAAQGQLMRQVSTTDAPGRTWAVAAPSWWNTGALQHQVGHPES